MQQYRVVVITGTAGDMGSVLVERFLANGDTVNRWGKPMSTMTDRFKAKRGGTELLKLLMGFCDE